MHNDGTPSGPLEGYLHDLWSKTESYKHPFTKEWWIAQQVIAIAYDRGTLKIGLDPMQSLTHVWRFAVKHSRE